MEVCVECGINKRAPKRRICYSCKYKKYKSKHPIKLAYYSLKGHAKERGKFFDLTFEEFKEFCIKTEYINKKGKDKYSYHIDRIDESKGYTKNNIQLLTNTDNIKKYITWKGLDENGKNIFTTQTKKIIEDDNDCPF